MAKVAGRTRQRPGLVGRTARGTVRLGMLATAVFIGRKTASGGKARDIQELPAGRSAEPQGLGAAAGGAPGASHERDAAAVTNDDRGRGAEVPQEIPPRG